MPPSEPPTDHRQRADVLDQWVMDDGTEVIVRPLHADEEERERRFIEGLSQQSLYERTFSRRTRLKPGELEQLVRFDVRKQIALVAATLIGDQEEFIAVARLARGPDDAFEFAIVVHDGWQRRGVASRLMHTLLTAARHAGIERIGGVTLASNAAMLALARKIGFDVRRDPEDGTALLLALEL
jgi:acetyltransferase